MKKILTFLAQPACFLGSAALFLVFLVIVLPDQSIKAAVYTPENGGFDTRLFYDPELIPGQLEAYGDAGRQAYVRARWTFDLIWPLVYGLFCLSAVFFSVSRMPRLGKKGVIGYLAGIPLGAVIFDYLENILLSILMLRYPAYLPVLGYLAAGATLIKWILVIVSFIMAVSLPLALLFRKIQIHLKGSTGEDS